MESTPSINSIKKLGFTQRKTGTFQGREFEIMVCGIDKLILRQCYDGGWFWSINSHRE